MNITLSVDDEVVAQARQHAESLGTSVNQLVRQYLEQLAGKSDSKKAAGELEGLFRTAPVGDSGGWKFNREELYEEVLEERGLAKKPR